MAKDVSQIFRGPLYKLDIQTTTPELKELGYLGPANVEVTFEPYKVELDLQNKSGPGLFKITIEVAEADDAFIDWLKANRSDQVAFLLYPLNEWVNESKYGYWATPLNSGQGMLFSYSVKRGFGKEDLHTVTITAQKTRSGETSAIAHGLIGYT